MPLGKLKLIMRQLGFINSFRLMANSLDSLIRNSVGTNGMACKECGSETELKHINENYVTCGTYRRCQGVGYQKLDIDPIFDNLRVGCMDEQF